MGGRRAGCLRVASEVELEILVGVEFGPVGGGGEVSRVRSRVGTDGGVDFDGRGDGVDGLDVEVVGGVPLEDWGEN
jgi:hypothetical protein